MPSSTCHFKRTSTTRRDVLRLLAAGGAFIVTPVIAGAGTMRRLVPERWSSHSADYLVIDAHSHIFNAADLSVQGYATNSILHIAELNLSDERKTALTVAVEKFAAVARRAAPTVQEEQQRLDELAAQGINPLGEGWTYADVAALRDARTRGEDRPGWDEILHRSVEQMPPEERSSLLDTIEDAEPAQEARAVSGATRGGDPIDVLRSILDFLQNGPDYVQLAATWYERMSRYRFEIARELLDTYEDVDLFVIAMVDMECWLGGQPSDLREQMLLTERIAVMSGGRFLPFVSYDPRRDVEEDGAGLALVKEAVSDHGFAGVKMYPSNGFRPLGNAELADDDFGEIMCMAGESSQSRGHVKQLGERMDERLRSLYDFCQEEGVPIMAHGTPSKGTRQGWELRGGPEFWERVNEQYPALRINIAHFGGMESLSERELIRRSWLSTTETLVDEPDNWALQILHLMGTHPNLYADVGMFHILDEGPAQHRFFENLQALLSNDHFPAGRGRLLYGSDWYMLAIVRGHERYLEGFESSYRDRVGEGVEEFMGRNAVAYLGLAEGEPSRRRLDAYYASRGIRGLWREMVDRG